MQRTFLPWNAIIRAAFLTLVVSAVGCATSGLESVDSLTVLQPRANKHDGVCSLAVSADGSRMVSIHEDLNWYFHAIDTGARRSLGGPPPGARCRVWRICGENDAVEHSLFTLPELVGWLRTLTIDPDGKSVVVAAERGLMKWNVADQSSEWKSYRCLAASTPSGNTVVDLDEQNRSHLVDDSSGKSLGFLEPKCDCMMAFSHDGRLLAGLKDGDVYLWDIPSGTQRTRARVPGFKATLNGPRVPVEFSPDDKLAAVSVAADDGKHAIAVLDMQQNACFFQQPVSDDWYSVAFSPNSKTLAIGDRSGRIRIVDTAMGFTLREWKATSAACVTALCFVPSGKYLASGDSDGEIKFWTIARCEYDFASEMLTDGLRDLADDIRINTAKEPKATR